MNQPTHTANDAKQVFRQCGTCSQTFGHILNREFGHPKDNEERALDPLAGGISNEGHQCGMLWGTALALGTEAYRRHKDSPDMAIAAAVTATQHIVESFIKQTDTVNCREIIGFNLNSALGLFAYMLKVTIQGMDNSKCFNLAERWAPEAIQAGKEGLAEATKNNVNCTSCASEVAKLMGASEEEQVMVAGFAGGLGLSGNACGALAAAIWMKTLAWCKENPGKQVPFLKNPEAKKLLEAFREIAGPETQCHKICGRQFDSIADHTDYIQNGGCEKLLASLAQH